MFTFTHERWAVVVLAIYIVVWVICWLIVSFVQRKARYETRNRTSWLIGIGLFVLGVAAVNGIAWGVSVSSTEDRSATYGPCTVVIHDLLLNCQKPTLETPVTLSDEMYEELPG
jgi:uncharacterized membrane protein YadS